MQIRAVERVAVAQAHPGLNPCSPQSVDALIQPVEIVDALLFLALGPTALQPAMLHAQLADVVLVDAENRLVTIERLAAHRPLRRLDLPGVPDGELQPICFSSGPDRLNFSQVMDR